LKFDPKGRKVLANFSFASLKVSKSPPCIPLLKNPKNTEKRNQDSQTKTARGKIMRPSFKNFKAKALQNPDIAKEYYDLSPAYTLRRELIRIRKEAGLTQ